MLQVFQVVWSLVYDVFSTIIATVVMLWVNRL